MNATNESETQALNEEPVPLYGCQASPYCPEDNGVCLPGELRVWQGKTVCVHCFENDPAAVCQDNLEDELMWSDLPRFVPAHERRIAELGAGATQDHFTMRRLDVLAESAEDDCQRAIGAKIKVEHDLKCLQESTVDKKAYEVLQQRIERLETFVVGVQVYAGQHNKPHAALKAIHALTTAILGEGG